MMVLGNTSSILGQPLVEAQLLPTETALLTPSVPQAMGAS